jgi:tetratricopeptide (TPR) repeat protein
VENRSARTVNGDSEMTDAIRGKNAAQNRIMVMTSRSSAPFWILLAVLAVLVGAGALVAWRGFRAPPDLGAICALAREGQFDRAQALMRRYLHAFPGDNRAHLLMAQFAMDRPDAQPQLALDHLGRIRARTPKEAAVVRFSVGKAHYQQKRYDLAETCWKESLELDPAVPEAGWALIDLLDFEVRTEEAHRLGMRLFEVEPDRRDRARLLLEMSRLEIDKVAPGSVVQVFEPVCRQHPEYLPLALAVGLALVHNSQSAAGIEVLRDALERHPDSAEAWDAWLTGLDEGYQPDLLRLEFARLPGNMAGHPRFAKHEGTVAHAAGDWPKAVKAYRRAYALEPFNSVVLYRLRMALRDAGETAELRRADQLLAVYQSAVKQLRGVYDEAFAIKSLGLEPRTELYHRLAELREQMGRFDEARAWHRLVLGDVPDDALSLAALARLK